MDITPVLPIAGKNIPDIWTSGVWILPRYFIILMQLFYAVVRDPTAFRGHSVTDLEQRMAGPLISLPVQVRVVVGPRGAH